jgi:hypothetical protein
LHFSPCFHPNVWRLLRIEQRENSAAAATAGSCVPSENLSLLKRESRSSALDRLLLMKITSDPQQSAPSSEDMALSSEVVMQLVSSLLSLVYANHADLMQQ